MEGSECNWQQPPWTPQAPDTMATGPGEAWPVDTISARHFLFSSFQSIPRRVLPHMCKSVEVCPIPRLNGPEALPYRLPQCLGPAQEGISEASEGSEAPKASVSPVHHVFQHCPRCSRPQGAGTKYHCKHMLNALKSKQTTKTNKQLLLDKTLGPKEFPIHPNLILLTLFKERGRKSSRAWDARVRPQGVVLGWG